MSGYTYILQLQDNHWYVGFTNDLANRIVNHLVEKPQVRWLVVHKPVRLYKVVEGNREQELTISMMRKFGWSKVRGYCWTKVNLQSAPKVLMRKIT